MRARLAGLLLAIALPLHAEEPSPEAVLAVLPFLDYHEKHRVVVDLAKPGNRPLRFLVDTGATHTVATPRAANELGIRVRRHKRDPYRRATVLGRDVHIWVDTSVSDTGSRTGRDYALLGGQFLGKYVVEFDFEIEYLRILDAKRYRVPESVDAPDEAVLPLKLRSNRPGIEILVEGTPMVVLLDTGAPLPILLSGKAAEKAGVAPRVLLTGTAHGVMGALRSELRWLESMALGPFRFAGVPALVSPRGWHNHAMSNDSVIGYELLQLFTMRIDYPRKRIWLKRRTDVDLTYRGRDFDDAEDLLEKLGVRTEG